MNRFREATVGAGLRVIDTLQQLHASVNRADSVGSSPSGTTGFLFSEIGRGPCCSTQRRLTEVRTTTTRWMATTPGSIGNLGPGLDVLGCALAGPRDEVIAECTASAGIVILDAGHPELPCTALQHASAIAASAVLALAGGKGIVLRTGGIGLTVRKGLPLSGGQGGSAASAVAGAAAVNALLGASLTDDELLACALVAEAKVAGRHLDNIAPALFGGIVLVRSLDPIEVVRLPVPAGLRIVLAQPHQRLSTARARRALPHAVERSVVIHQLAQVGALVAACFTNDLHLFGRSIDDRIAEPVRAGLIQGFAAAKRAAVEAGALGVSVSGSGPTTFAIVRDMASGAQVATAMHAAYAREGVPCSTRVTDIDLDGTIVTSMQE